MFAFSIPATDRFCRDFSAISPGPQADQDRTHLEGK